jgi:hypothetical protein
MSLRRVKQLNRIAHEKRLASCSEKNPTCTAWVAKINNRWLMGGINNGRLLK